MKNRLKDIINEPPVAIYSEALALPAATREEVLMSFPVTNTILRNINHHQNRKHLALTLSLDEVHIVHTYDIFSTSHEINHLLRSHLTYDNGTSKSVFHVQEIYSSISMS